ncbi:MAG: hypothetical protein R3E77_10350 [Steroidobacteraceae bacterium]
MKFTLYWVSIGCMLIGSQLLLRLQERVATTTTDAFKPPFCRACLNKWSFFFLLCGFLYLRWWQPFVGYGLALLMLVLVFPAERQGRARTWSSIYAGFGVLISLVWLVWRARDVLIR